MRFVLAFFLLFLFLFASDARAHDFEPGVLAIVEDADGRITERFTPPTDGEVKVVHDGDAVVFEGLRRGAKVVVSVRRRDGRSFEAVATAEQPRVEIARAAPSSFLAFVRLGLEHVATGLDHVAFVCGLFLIVGANRRLVATITAFTVAHSLTLALAAFDVVALPRAPVEATIAASVLLVAVEATSRRRTWTKRRPWLVAFAFGLVHGLGFAGALGELGLPHAALPKTLLAFNVGVEIAQLALVGVLVAAERAFLAKKRPRTALAYAIGTFGAYWLVERTVAMLTSAS
jgi:hypothetical protein